jgi:biopolymer transport protein TolR
MIFLKQKSRVICRIDVTAFAAVMIALVGICWAPMGYHSDLPGLGVDQPHLWSPTAQPMALREDAVVIAITRDGSTYVNSEKVAPGSLRRNIHEAMKHAPEPKVYVNADARSAYGSVLKALESIREAGVENVAFLGWERRKQQARTIPR